MTPLLDLSIVGAPRLSQGVDNPILGRARLLVVAPEVLGRLDLVLVLLGGAVLIEAAVAVWLTFERRAESRRDRAAEARIVRRYRDLP